MKIIYITNIPTPYRNYRFNVLSEKLSKLDVDFEVLFMNASEPDRNWPLNVDHMQYKYRIFSSRNVGQRLGMWMHVSLKLHWYILREKYDVAILGGLASPAHFIVSLLLKKSSINILSVESNPASIANKTGMATKIKSFLMKRFSNFQVTGVRSKAFIEHYVPKEQINHYISLPNIIDESVFESVPRAHIEAETKCLFDRERKQGNRIVLIPARLIEEKGLMSFFKALDSNIPLSVVVAGDGLLKNVLETYVKNNNLNVYFLGEKPAEQIVCMMRYADILALPSKRDASPLSVIEGLSCHLPLLLSRNVGNVKEVLDESKNGWSFVYDDLVQTKQAITQAAYLPDEELQKMKRYSRQIYDEKFSADKVLDSYISQIMDLKVS